MRILLDMANVLPSLLLLLGKRHNRRRNFSFCSSTLQIGGQVIILLRLDLSSLGSDALLLGLVLDLHVKILLKLLCWLRQLYRATGIAILLSNCGLRG